MKKTIILLMCFCLLFMNFAVFASESNIAEKSAEDTLTNLRSNSYQNYYKKYLDKQRPVYDIKFDNETAVLDEKGKLLEEFDKRENVIEWNGENTQINYTVEIPQTGCYSLKIEFMPLAKDIKEIEIGFKIDGQYPFQSAANMILYSAWENVSEISQDKKGNDRKPRQQRSQIWVEQTLSDPDGVSYASIPFYFEAGTHEITLDTEIAQIYLSSLILFNEKDLPTYDEYLNTMNANGAKNSDANTIVIEGESASYRSDPTLIPTTDRTSGKTSPSSPKSIKLNTIGQGYWKYSGQWITWKFKVEKSGYYQLGFRFKQDTLRGFFVTRRIFIDNTVPFKEFENVHFMYKNGWQFEFAKGEEPYKVYLEAGEHELKMETILGEFSDLLWELDDCFYKLNHIYRKIIMITGKQPDKYRDYFLEEQIPGLIETFEEIALNIETQAKKIENISKSSGSEAASLYEIVDQLRSFAKKPDTIKLRLDQFSSNISSLSAWILKMKEQPLELDYISLTRVNAEKDKADNNFFQNFVYRFNVFLYSFFGDYDSISDTDETKDSILVWLNLGMDQANIINSMVNDEFIPEYDININLKLVQGTLVEATLAGKGPDIAINTDRSTPVNLAARGALLDFKQFDDFDEVVKRFSKNAMIPYEFNGGCYALPMTQNFNMMFYRTDIFEELGLEVPQTWDELAKTIAVLQANNMQAGIGASIVSTQVAVADIFATLLLQRGLGYYNEDLSKTTFDTPEAVEAFEQWTQFYTQTTLPVSFDFYNRFRSGEMPLGIQSYTQYNLISVAAPEIRGMWEMVPIPGTPDENGNINRAEIAGGSSCIVFNTVKNKDDAWTFLKWWTSADAQERYGRDLEMIMGSAARYDTANIEAFERLPWTPREIKAISEQWDYVSELPEIPASYYTTRGVSNAFRKVVYNYENPREALFYQNKLINKEIKQKRIELNLE